MNINLENNDPKVLILGAGLAGLSCAKQLKTYNIPFKIIEASDRIGGRVYSETNSSNFIFDKGFQVLLQSYPELQKLTDLHKLKLKKFASGALIFTGQNLEVLANPLIHPKTVFKTINSSITSFKDQLLTLKLIFISTSHKDFKTFSKKSTLSYLSDFGFSEKFINYFWKPFMSGIYLDSELSLDSNYFLFLINKFSQGGVTVPEKGIFELAKLMAQDINSNDLILNTKVLSIKSDLKTNKTLVTTQDRINQSITDFYSQIVVKAYNESNTSSSAFQKFRSTTTFYFSTLIDPEWSNWLVLLPAHLGLNLNSIVIMNKVSASYAPTGQFLISATSLKPESELNVENIKLEIEKVAQKKLYLNHLKTDSIEKALPIIDNQITFKNFLCHGSSFYECGDHISSPSIEGALKSGRLVADEIKSQLLSLKD